MAERLEIKVGEKLLQVDKFTSYGFEKEFFAKVGKDLYYKTNSGYKLLKENFWEE